MGPLVDHDKFGGIVNGHSRHPSGIISFMKHHSREVEMRPKLGCAMVGWVGVGGDGWGRRPGGGDAHSSGKH